MCERAFGISVTWYKVIKTYLSLCHQLPLCRRSSFDKSAGGSCNGLGSLKNLLLKVQALVCLLFARKTNTLYSVKIDSCKHYIRANLKHQRSLQVKVLTG